MVERIIKSMDVYLIQKYFLMYILTTSIILGAF